MSIKSTILSGVKTLEFAVTMVALVGTILTTLGLPGIEVGAGVTLATWVVTRGIQKVTQKNAEGKRSYETTEFWIHLLTAGALQVFPDLPKEAAVTLWGAATTYSTSRTLAKAKS